MSTTPREGTTGLSLTSLDWLISHYRAKSHQRLRHLAQIPIYPGDHVLDVGCGPGLFTQTFGALVCPGGSAKGIDIDSRLLDFAESNAYRSIYSDMVSFEQVNFWNFPDRSTKFDVIVFFNNLSYVDCPDTLVAKYLKILKPSGRIILKDSDFGDFLVHPVDEQTRNEIIAGAFKNRFVSRHFDNFFGRRLPSILRRLDFDNISHFCWDYTMRQPLTDDEWQYIAGNLSILGEMARGVTLDLTISKWLQYWDRDSENCMFAESDFFFKMSEHIAIGKKTF